jgi:phage gpG-like protein
VKLYASLNTANGRKRFELKAQSAKQLDEVLKLFGKYLREKAKAKFQSEGPGWAPLADSTAKKQAGGSTSKTTRTGGVRQTSRVKAIVRSLERDKNRHGALLSSLRSVTRSGGGGNLGQLIRASALKPAQKKEALGIAAAVFKEQQRDKPGKRRKGKRRRLLGRLASTIRAKVKKQNLTVYSMVDWAGVHNEGGSAGKGVTIPARPFLELEEEDLEVLRKMLVEHVAGAGE